MKMTEGTVLPWVTGEWDAKTEAGLVQNQPGQHTG